MGRENYRTVSGGGYKQMAYYPTGKVKATWRSQIYPTWNVYDEQNRQTQLHTWKVAPTLNLAAIPANPPAGSEVTNWIYGATTGRLDRKQYADTKGTNYTYTAAGRLASRVWARGVTTSYTYNQGFLTLTDYSDTTPDVAITYEPLGRQSTVTQTSQSQITYYYDSTNLRLNREQVKYDIDRNGSYEFERSLTRSRDSLLRDTSSLLVTPSVQVESSFDYTYSASEGRLSTVTGSSMGTFNYNYLPNSNLISSVATSNVGIHTMTNSWEANRDVLDVKQNKVGTTVISSFDYAVNSLGQRTAVSQTGSAFPTLPSWAWGYDSLGQVTTADSNIAASDRAYEYDTIGNRKKSANSLVLPVANNYSANATNAYTSVKLPDNTVVEPSYDLDGNATAYPLSVFPNANFTLVWDGENRLISRGFISSITSYQYDALSRRIAKIDGSAVTARANLYLYDGWNCVAEYTKTAGATPVIALAKTQLWGMDLSGTLQGAGGVGGLLAVRSGTTTHFPTYDGNGNVSEYLTATGSIAAHFEYDPFGNTVVNTDTSNQFNYRFSTKPRDSETGLYYYGYRYYDPATGRWPSRDPIEEKGGINLYGMVRNNPIIKYDRLGLITPPPDSNTPPPGFEAPPDQNESDNGEGNDDPSTDAYTLIWVTTCQKTIKCKCCSGTKTCAEISVESDASGKDLKEARDSARSKWVDKAVSACGKANCPDKDSKCFPDSLKISEDDCTTKSENII